MVSIIIVIVIIIIILLLLSVMSHINTMSMEINQEDKCQQDSLYLKDFSENSCRM